MDGTWLRNDAEDEEIIKLLFDREEGALERIWRKYEGFCKSIVPDITREDFEECFDDTLMRVWKTIPPERPRCLKMYVGTIMRGLIIDRLRANDSKKRGGGERDIPLEEAEALFDFRDFADVPLKEETVAKLVRKYLDKLPMRKRRIFINRFWYFRSVNDIAEMFLMNPNTVKSVLSRLRKDLRTFLRENDVDA